MLFLPLLILVLGYYGCTHPPEVERKTRVVIADVQEQVEPIAPTEPSDSKPAVAPQQQNQLVLSVESNYDNLSLGTPGQADTIIDREGYALGYIEYHEQAAWVVYKMTAEEATTKVAKRSNNFREDSDVPTGSGTLADYYRSGYDRGHLAPAGDMAFSSKVMSESFYMSNISPQKPSFNRGIWKALESLVRHFAVKEKAIYVVTGPILPKTKTITIGQNNVTVPLAYYKVIYDTTPPEKMIGFIIPSDSSGTPLQKFAVTVDVVEEATGLDFFSLVPQPKQEQLESTISIKDWQWGQ